MGTGISFLVIAVLVAILVSAAAFMLGRPAVTRLALPTSPSHQRARPVSGYSRFPPIVGKFHGGSCPPRLLFKATSTVPVSRSARANGLSDQATHRHTAAPLERGPIQQAYLKPLPHGGGGRVMRQGCAGVPLLVLVAITMSGCALRGAPSFVLLGAFFTAWMSLADIAILTALGARVALVAAGLSGILPLQLLVCASAGLTVAILAYGPQCRGFLLLSLPHGAPATTRGRRHRWNPRRLRKSGNRRFWRTALTAPATLRPHEERHQRDSRAAVGRRDVRRARLIRKIHGCADTLGRVNESDRARTCR